MSNGTKVNPQLNLIYIYIYIPTAPTYGVYISHVILYSRACGSLYDFFDKGLLLTKKLLKQGFLVVKWKSSLGKMYSRHHDLVKRYRIPVSQMNMDFFRSA